MQDETQQQRSIFGLFQIFIYVFIFIDIYTQCLSFTYESTLIGERINHVLYQMPVFTNTLYSHITVFIMILILAGLTQSRKNIHFDFHKHFTYWFIIGILLFIASIFLLNMFSGKGQFYIYGATYLTGAIFLHVAISNLSKKIFSGLKKDVWNTLEESFKQNIDLKQTEYSFNLPISFYYRKRLQQGWININPFRALMVIGVPGSGKTVSTLIPYIKQLLHKGFSMLIYDYKFPDLTGIAYHHYIVNQVNNGPLKNHKFHIINLDDIERSRRINPIAHQYIKTLGDASESAEAIISALKKSDKAEGSQQFFTQSAINFLSAVIYYLATCEGGKYSTLPHVIALISMSYDRIFNALFSHPELMSLLAPFKSAYENKAFDQLEGQIGTIRINISRIATKEAFWVFSGNDFDLKFSNPPSIVILANSPATQSMNTAFYSAALMRITRLINTKNNCPAALVIDEMPTIYLHKIENLLATARSNRVAVALGLQELPQLQLQYGKELANSIVSIMGSILSGAVRNKETLEWLERLFGKIKQTSTGVSIDRSRTNISMNERMETVIPAAKIANLNAGELVGLVSRENEISYGMYKPNMFHCKVNIDLKKDEAEKKHYKELPKFYTFGTEADKSAFLLKHMQGIYNDIDDLLP